jgi:hypothetical protein
MSTKNLARTVIEGGRRYSNVWRRRHTHRQERAMVRDALLSTVRSPDTDNLIIPKREQSYREFHDKLSPAKRWLEAQAGRPWAKVRGELFTRFDIRTTPGRHIVFDHMLPWIENDSTRRSWRDFWIDEHGLLRVQPKKRRQRYRICVEASMTRCQIERWLDGRRVGQQGDLFFWLVATPFGAFRQHRRMSPEDAAIWSALPIHYQEHYNGV